MKIVAYFQSVCISIDRVALCRDENVCADYFYHHERNKGLCKPHNVRPLLKQTTPQRLHNILC